MRFRDYGLSTQQVARCRPTSSVASPDGAVHPAIYEMLVENPLIPQSFTADALSDAVLTCERSEARVVAPDHTG